MPQEYLKNTSRGDAGIRGQQRWSPAPRPPPPTPPNASALSSTGISRSAVPTLAGRNLRTAAGVARAASTYRATVAPMYVGAMRSACEIGAGSKPPAPWAQSLDVTSGLLLLLGEAMGEAQAIAALRRPLSAIAAAAVQWEERTDAALAADAAHEASAAAPAAATGEARAIAPMIWPVALQVRTMPPQQSSASFGSASRSGRSHTAGNRNAGTRTTGSDARIHADAGPSALCNAVPARGTAATAPRAHNAVTEAGRLRSHAARAAAVLRSAATKNATPPITCSGPSLRHNELPMMDDVF